MKQIFIKLTSLVLMLLPVTILAQAQIWETEIQVYPKPTISINTTTFCQGDSAILTLTGTAPFIVTFTGSLGSYTSPMVFGGPGLTLTTGVLDATTGSTTYTVNLVAGIAGTFALTDISISDFHDCSNSIEDKTIIVHSKPNCSITGVPAGNICPEIETSFNASANMIAYAWTITGNGTATSTVNEQTVNVKAGINCGISYTAQLAITDNNGCENVCMTEVMVQDNIAPTFTAPSDVIIYTDVDCNYDITVAETGDVIDENDNCSTGLQATFVDGPLMPIAGCQSGFTIERTWSLTDDCGNVAADQIQTITILDNTKPSISGIIKSDTVCNDSDVPAAKTDIAGLQVLGLVISDNCTSSNDLIVGHTQFRNGSKITRTYTVEDLCGNKNSVDHIIIISSGPQVGFVAPAPLCAGDSLFVIPVINDNGYAISKYVWYIGPDIVARTKDIRYEVSIADSGKNLVLSAENDCGVAFSSGTILQIYSRPNDPVLSINDTNTCSGTVLDLHDFVQGIYTSPLELLFYFYDGSNNIVYVNGDDFSVDASEAYYAAVRNIITGCISNEVKLDNIRIFTLPGAVPVFTNYTTIVCAGTTVNLSQFMDVDGLSAGQEYVYYYNSGTEIIDFQNFAVEYGKTYSVAVRTIGSTCEGSRQVITGLTVDEKTEFGFNDIVFYGLSFDLKNLTLSHGDTAGLILTYYDQNYINLANTIISVSGVYHITGINIVGCSDTSTVNVIIDPRPEFSFKGDTVCAPNTVDISRLSLISGNIDNLTFTYHMNDYSELLNMEVDVTGTYHIIGESAGGYKDTSTVEIVINGKPEFTFGSVLSCAQTTVELKELSLVSGDTIGLDFRYYDVNYTSLSITDVATGTYHIIGISDAGCSDTSTVVVSIVAKPEFSFKGDTVCYPNTVELNELSKVDGDTNGVMLRYYDANYNELVGTEISTIGAGTYHIIGTRLGCSDTSTVEILISPKPFFNFDDIALHSSQQVDLDTLTPVSGSKSGLVMSYYDVSASMVLTNTIVSTAGTYYITGKNEYDCQYIDTIEITIGILPSIENVSLSVCSGSDFEYSPSHGGGTSGKDVVPAGTTYSWSVPAESIIGTISPSELLPGNNESSINAASLTSSHSVPTSVVYTVTPQYGNTQGTPFTVTVIVNPVPKILLASNSVNICCGETFLFNPDQCSNMDLNNVRYTWLASCNGDVTGHSNCHTPADTLQHRLSHAMNHEVDNHETVEYKIIPQSDETLGGCAADTITYSVNVQPRAMIANTDQTISICEGEEMPVLTATSTTNNATFNWYSDQTCESLLYEGSESYQPATTGIYYVRSIHSSGCHSTDATAVEVLTNVLPIFEYDEIVSLCLPQTVDLSELVPVSGDVSDLILNYYDENYALLTNTVINTDGIFHIIGTSSEGCSDTASIIVTSTEKPEIELVGTYTVCNKETSILLDYTNENDLTLEYIITFSDNAKSAGFQEMLTYTLMDDDIVINIPTGLPIDDYTGTLTIRSGSCDESYNFTIMITNPTLITKQPLSIVGICEGDNLLLSIQVSGTNITYQWYHNNTAITGAINNEYSAIYHSGLGGDYYVEIISDCGTINSNIVTISNPIYQIEEKWNDMLFIADPSANVVAYQWYKNGQEIKGARARYYSDGQGLQGDYYVRVYLADGSFISTCSVTYDRLKQVNDNLYPNPAERSTLITIELGDVEETSSSKLELYDVQGKLIRTQMVEGNRIQIQAPELAGSYIVRIHTESSKIITKRLIVK